MKRRICSILLCLTVIVLSSPLAYGVNQSSNVVTTDQYTAYVSSIIPDLVKLPDVDLPSSGISISQPFAILNDEDDSNYAVFLFTNQSCNGLLIVNIVDGDFHASFVNYELADVFNAYKDGMAFSLLALENAIVMCTTTENTIIFGRYDDDSNHQSVATYCEENMELASSCRQMVKLTLVPSVIESRSYGTPSTSASLDVPYVANAQVNGAELCWAAATASVVRYLRGGSVTATEIYNRVSTVIPSPTGTTNSVLRGLSFYGINNYSSQSTSISFVAMTRQIDAGYPLVLAFMGTSQSVPAAHGVVVCGYMCESDGSVYLQFVDSNVEQGKVWITVNRDTNTFVYNPSALTTYTSWHWSVHCATVT